MALPLVICIGNLARGDDGVAHRVADLLADRGDIRVLAAPQLAIEMAEEIAAVPLVVFVDAERRTAPHVETVEVAAGPVDPRSAHGLSPAAMLALAGSLYGTAPRGVLVSVAGPEMGHGMRLSATAEAASSEAASVIAGIVSGETA